jgi:hypothetical protein
LKKLTLEVQVLVDGHEALREDLNLALKAIVQKKPHAPVAKPELCVADEF